MVETTANGDGTAGAPYFANNLCLSDGCYTLNMYDTAGDGWNGDVITISGVGVRQKCFIYC